MAANQVYDKDGTTNFQFTFIDQSVIRKRYRPEWHVQFAQGHISINNYSATTLVKVSFPPGDHWVYEGQEEHLHRGAVCSGSKIETKDFMLTVSVRRYLDAEEENECYLELDTKFSSTSMMIPYKLALALMKFMSGSTDLEGVSGVHKKI